MLCLAMMKDICSLLNIFFIFLLYLVVSILSVSHLLLGVHTNITYILVLNCPMSIQYFSLKHVRTLEDMHFISHDRAPVVHENYPKTPSMANIALYSEIGINET